MTFETTFEKICEVLKIRCNVIVKIKHKAIGKERCHKLLSHSQEILIELLGATEFFY